MFNNRIRKNRIESWLAIGAIVAIVIAWFVGRQLEDADTVSLIKEKMPYVAELKTIEGATYEIFNAQGKPLGYLTLESSMGYGGPIQMAVAVDSAGVIFDLAVIGSKETPSYLDKVLKAKFLDELIGRSYNDEYSIGNGVDAISSATYSSQAIVEASKKGNRYLASNILGLETPKEEMPTLTFGMAELTLLVLFAIGYFAHKKTFKYTKTIRWVTMITGLLVIGFYYNKPFTLSMVNQLLLGYFPPLHSHLYWYLLLGGIFLVLTISNKNPYCQWFCPFGAAQECMGLAGGAKNRSVGRFKNILKWALRFIVLFAIIVALLFRNPGVSSYEIFGTLFKLTGSNIQFALLGIVLVSSLFIKRPWCNYLCPIKPLTDHLSYTRKLLLQRLKKQNTAA